MTQFHIKKTKGDVGLNTKIILSNLTIPTQVGTKISIIPNLLYRLEDKNISQ